MQELAGMTRKAVFLTAVAFAVAAHGQTPAFDLHTWKGIQAGPPTQILVLGSPHLSEFKAGMGPQLLEPLLNRLAAFRPTVITHEGISGEQCDNLKRYAVKYPGVFDQYCWGTEEAEKATGLTVATALAQIENALGAWPAAPTAAQRRHLAALFLAANDRPSAQVQWQRLEVGERRTGDGIDPSLLKILTRADAKPNETYQIGVALAARLGLERVYAVDDHTADSIEELAGPAFGPAIQKLWSNNSDLPEHREQDRRTKSLTTGDDLLDLYRFLNQPVTQRAFVSADFGAALRQDSPELYGRQYVAWWETRNLRMVANIRAAFGNHPGARVLNIVGASHKPYYDSYLSMMHEVSLVDAEAILK
jgi:Family of unknown function (DUF5694)